MADKLDECKSLEEVEALLTGRMSEHYRCIDCGFNTHPGCPTKKEVAKGIWEARLAGVEWQGYTIAYGWDCETYIVRDAIWKKAGMEGYGGCLCIGCLGKRLRRKLKPKDFDHKHPFNDLPGTERLLRCQGRLKNGKIRLAPHIAEQLIESVECDG